MSKQTKKKKVTISSWEQVVDEENRILQHILAVETPAAVEAAVSFAGFVRAIGLNSENYPLFFRLLDVENHWVTDALLGDDDPFQFFSLIPPNDYLLARGFRLLSRRGPGGIYPKTMGVVLGILERTYGDPRNGYRIYPLSIADIDNLAKHLDKGADQDDPVNRCILDIFEKISDLDRMQGDGEIDLIAKQAGRIRTSFFDNRKSLASVIPESLTIRGNYLESEVHPEKLYVN